MLKFLAALIKIMKVLTVVVPAVQVIEEAVGPGFGNLKEGMLLDAVNSVQPMKEEETAMVKTLTASVVKSFKVIDQAKKDAAAQT